MSAFAFQSYSLDTLNAGSRARYRKFILQFSITLSYYDEEVYDIFAISPLSESIVAFLYEEGQEIACEV